MRTSRAKAQVMRLHVIHEPGMQAGFVSRSIFISRFSVVCLLWKRRHTVVKNGHVRLQKSCHSLTPRRLVVDLQRRDKSPLYSIHVLHTAHHDNHPRGGGSHTQHHGGVTSSVSSGEIRGPYLF